MGGGALKLEAVQISQLPLPLFTEQHRRQLDEVGHGLRRNGSPALAGVDTIMLAALQKMHADYRGDFVAALADRTESLETNASQECRMSEDLTPAKEMIRRCLALRDLGRPEAVLRSEVQSALRTVFPNVEDKQWIDHYVEGTEAHKKIGKVGGATATRFIDNLIGSTTIEYESDLGNVFKREVGYGQVRSIRQLSFAKGFPLRAFSASSLTRSSGTLMRPTFPMGSIRKTAHLKVSRLNLLTSFGSPTIPMDQRRA